MFYSWCQFIGRNVLWLPNLLASSWLTESIYMLFTFKRYDIKVIILLLFTIAETLSCTYILRSSIDAEVVAIIYFLSGLGIGLLPLLPQKLHAMLQDEAKIPITINRWLIPIGFILIGGFFVWQAISIISTLPIDVLSADMLPQIQVMCQRLIDGEKIYAPIMEIWNGKQPPYMPLMWLPFTFAQWAGIDIRFTTIVFFLLGLYCTYKLLPKSYAGNPLIVFVSFISLFMLLNFLLLKDKITFGLTEEGIVIAYYLFLALALISKKPILIGIAIACCLMSRFSLFFWVPMYLIHVFVYESRKQAYTVTAVIAIIILLVFLLPFGFRQPEYFLNIPADYHVGVDNALRYNDDENGKYYQNFLGYARYFDISQIKLLHDLQIIVAAILPFLMLGIYRLINKRIQLNTAFFGICTLKIVLVFFYNMVEVPYFYLFFFSTFFSYSVLFAYVRQRYAVNGSSVVD